MEINIVQYYMAKVTSGKITRSDWIRNDRGYDKRKREKDSRRGWHFQKVDLALAVSIHQDLGLIFYRKDLNLGLEIARNNPVQPLSGKNCRKKTCSLYTGASKATKELVKKNFIMCAAFYQAFPVIFNFFCRHTYQTSFAIVGITRLVYYHLIFVYILCRVIHYGNLKIFVN